MLSNHFVFFIAFLMLNIQDCLCQNGSNETNSTISSSSNSSYVTISSSSNSYDVTISSSSNSSNTTVATTTIIMVATTTVYIEPSSPVDYYSSVDSRLTNMINAFYPGLTNQQVAFYTANISVKFYYFFLIIYKKIYL